MVLGEEFLRKLFDEMIERYRIGREEWRQELLDSTGSDHVFFVHELLECSYKREMRKRFPEIEIATTFNPRFVVGWLIEEALRNALKAHPMRWHTTINVSGKRVTVAGEADIVVFDSQDIVVIEVKYLTGLYGTPHQHHIDQLRAYMWGLDAKKGELWMISPEGVVFHEIGKAMSDEEIKALVELSLNGEEKPRYAFECKFCPYESFCLYSNVKRRETR